MKKYIILALVFIMAFKLTSQNEVKISVENADLYGTLLTPNVNANKAILIISGSGATDRDGNTKPNYINNGLKKLAEELTESGYATLRFDKRGVGKSVSESMKAENLRFEQNISDAGAWISFLKKSFQDITVIGHSQGALVGMLAVQKNQVNRFISLAGLSEDGSTTIKRQLGSQPQFVIDAAFPLLDSLKAGFKVYNVPQYLNNLFGPQIQDFFISFMKYDPREEIKKLNCPVLVIQGTTDLQITVDGATEMSRQAQNPTLKIMDGMNHVLRKTSSEASENIAAYNNLSLPLHSDLIITIKEFLDK